uniref:Uncharacterized protein n=1 Tax=Anguilla anguilla TaxID=7936 RepID=A0A0E9V1I9_ANGAN
MFIFDSGTLSFDC